MIARMLLAAVLLLMLAACAPSLAAPAPAPTATPLPLETILPRNAIRALDHPATVMAAAASAHVAALDMVMGVRVGEAARAYPIGLLSRYEIANDTLGGLPIAVTFCPLCNSGVVFERTVGADEAPDTLFFEVSGKLLDNALVMVDRESETLWAQSRAVGVAGPLAGTELELVAATQMTWQDWAAAHPDTTLVIDEQAQPAAIARVLPSARGALAAPETVQGYVIGVASGDTSIAIPLDYVEVQGVVNAEVASLPPFLLAALDEPGAVTVWQRTHAGQTLSFQRDGAGLRDAETGTRWNRRTGAAEEGPLAGAQLKPFPTLLTHWLGWADLHPETEVWTGCEGC